MKIEIEINTENAAFCGTGGKEVGRILNEWIETRLDRYGLFGDLNWVGGPLKDVNGNTCGGVSITKE